MNGRVRREYVQRLSKNLTNQELGLRSMEEEEEEENYDSSPPLRSDGKRNRESLAQAEYRKKYNQTLKAVQRNRKTSYKLKRRKIAPSLQTNNKKKNNRFRVVSPYFPVDDDDDGDDVESEEEEPYMSSSSSTVSRRRLGRMAASKYPISGLLDSLGLSKIGLALGDSSFDVDAIKKFPGDIPREDGFLNDDDPASPFGDVWQSKESARQKLLENDLNYRFIYLLAGNVSSSVTKLYDEDRLEDMLLRRMNIRRQMQRIHQIEEVRIPQIQAEIHRVTMTLEAMQANSEALERHQASMTEAGLLFDRLDKLRKKTNDVTIDFLALGAAQDLLSETQRILVNATWVNDLGKLKITGKPMRTMIQKCTKFLFDTTEEASVETQVLLQRSLDIAPLNPGNLLRALFVCLSHFVAYLWQRAKQHDKGIKVPVFEGASSGTTIMEQWNEVVGDQDFFELKNPPWKDLNIDDAYGKKLTSLRNVWISYWVPKSEKEEKEESTAAAVVVVVDEEGEEDTLPPRYPKITHAMVAGINRAFSSWVGDLKTKINKLIDEQIPIQIEIQQLAAVLLDPDFPEPQNLDEWEEKLFDWTLDVKETRKTITKEQKYYRKKLQTATEELKDMETIQPPRVKYQHRKGWALSPQHSGHIPLDAKVVAGIEAAMDVMRDVKNELRGARASYIVNVLRAGAEQLQHSSLSRAAFAKLVASRMALQEEYFPTTWTRKEQMGRVRLWASSALLSLSNLRWTGTKLVNRQSASSNLYNRILMQPASSLW